MDITEAAACTLRGCSLLKSFAWPILTHYVLFVLLFCVPSFQSLALCELGFICVSVLSTNLCSPLSSGPLVVFLPVAQYM